MSLKPQGLKPNGLNKPGTTTVLGGYYATMPLNLRYLTKMPHALTAINTFHWGKKNGAKPDKIRPSAIFNHSDGLSTINRYCTTLVRQ